MSLQAFASPTTLAPTVTPAPGALLKYFQKNGKMPPVSLSIFPLENLQKEIFIDRFISYNFQSSILVPVDAFQAEAFYKPQKDLPKPQNGDICVLRANGVPIATGIVDQLDMETEATTGTRLNIQGRDLLGQFEDQDSVSFDSKILWGNKYSASQVIAALSKDTRINPANLIQRTAPQRPYLFATQPGESKLSSLQRFCESLDIYFWMSGDGNLIIGKPDMYGTREGRKGEFFLMEGEGRSNVLSMRSTRAATSIPNMIVPIWNGQETVQNRITEAQALKNGAPGPARLLALGHRTPKAVIVSTPEGSAPQDLAELNALLVAGQGAGAVTRAGANTILQSYAKREMARMNIKDLTVQAVVPGHYTANAEPLQVDQVYNIKYESDDVSEDMFLYEVDYTMSEGEGQRTRMFFCRQGALVSDVRAL